jgi:hypothetical protein
MKDELIKIISDYGTWQTDSDGREGTWIDTDDIASMADEIMKFVQKGMNEKNNF